MRDRLLRFVVAMKLSLPHVTAQPALRRRFLDEAPLTAQLHPPCIIAVHDLGELEDGRLYFTMEEVRGRTLAEAMAGMSLREGVEVLLHAARAVGYAHGRGVVHRDLKPENLMVGEHQEVRVMDWGLARHLDEADPLAELDLGPRDVAQTQVGQVMGTLAWMPPEQARGRLGALGPEANVYSLGAILYALLVGHPPYQGPQAWQALLGGPPPPPLQGPEALRSLCMRAMARAPWERPLTGTALARELDAWLREDHAERQVDEAEALLPRLEQLSAQALAAEVEAAELLAGLPPFASAAQKSPGWRAEDQAASLRREQRLLELELVQRLRAALTEAPDLASAHALLARRYRLAMEAAEARRDLDAAAELEVLVAAHDRGGHAAWLQGDGRLSLVTQPPAEVLWYRNLEQDRRLVPVLQGSLGATPLQGVVLPRGSHLLELCAPGCVPVRYPVLIERGQHWDGVAPGDAAEDSAAAPIHLPRLGKLGADECYVPAGWCWTGGDPEAPDGLPARRVWVDGFAMRRHPVTNREYLAFLEDLGAQADAWVPRDERTAVLRVYRQGADGRRQVDPSLAPWGDPDAPVTEIDWWAARRFAAWEAARTGLPWRLPHELEWEKAARGVDRRRVPGGICWSPPGPASAAPAQGHRRCPRWTPSRWTRGRQGCGAWRAMSATGAAAPTPSGGWQRASTDSWSTPPGSLLPGTSSRCAAAPGPAPCASSRSPGASPIRPTVATPPWASGCAGAWVGPGRLSLRRPRPGGPRRSWGCRPGSEAPGWARLWGRSRRRWRCRCATRSGPSRCRPGSRRRVRRRSSARL